MRPPRALLVALIVLGCAAVGRVSLGQPGEPVGKVPTWQAPSAEQARAKVFAWLDEKNVDAAVRAKAEGLWQAKAQAPTGDELLERVIQTVTLVDENARKLAELCSRPSAPLSLPAQPWLSDAKNPAWIARNIRLWYGRWLAQHRLFDEALEQLEGIQPEEVVDPASLLFYQAIVYHRLLNRDAAAEAVARLLDAPEHSPRRYITVARLIESDVKDMKEDSLDHIARRMEDIQRRLDLGRGGPKVRKSQDEVIKALDKLIEELDAMQQQQQAAGGGESVQPNSPAKDSVPMGGKGPGNVTKRDVGHQSGWGNLPPKQREEALQQIGRDFPAHYRDIIEQYFRKLASDGSR